MSVGTGVLDCPPTPSVTEPAGETLLPPPAIALSVASRQLSQRESHCKASPHGGGGGVADGEGNSRRGRCPLPPQIAFSPCHPEPSGTLVSKDLKYPCNFCKHRGHRFIAYRSYPLCSFRRFRCEILRHVASQRLRMTPKGASSHTQNHIDNPRFPPPYLILYLVS